MADLKLIYGAPISASIHRMLLGQIFGPNYSCYNAEYSTLSILLPAYILGFSHTYFSALDINTTVSTCLEGTKKMPYPSGTPLAGVLYVFSLLS